MFRHILFASLIAVGMSSCAVLVAAPGLSASLAPIPAVAAAR